MNTPLAQQRAQRQGRWVLLAVSWFGVFAAITACLAIWRLSVSPPYELYTISMPRYLSPSGWQNGRWPQGRTMNFAGVEREPETITLSVREVLRKDTFLGLPLADSHTVTRIDVSTSSPKVNLREAMEAYLLDLDHDLQKSLPYWPDGGYHTAMVYGRQRAAQWHPPGIAALIATAAALACVPVVAVRVIRTRIARSRTSKGECAKCGYAIASLGVDAETVCPECGSPVTPAAAVCSNNG